MNTIDAVNGPSAASPLWRAASALPTQDDGPDAAADGPGRMLQALEHLLAIVAQLLMQQYTNGEDPAGSEGSGPAGPAPAGPAPAAGPQASAAAPAATPAPAPAPTAPSPAAPAQPAAAPAQSSAPVTGNWQTDPDMSPQQIASTYKDEIARASQASGIPGNLLAGMIWQESKGKPGTPGGGLMQVGEKEFEKYGTGGDLANPADNIMAGAMYMKSLKDKFGSVEAALRAYNSGPDGIDLNNLNATPAGTGDPTYIGKVMKASQEAG